VGEFESSRELEYLFLNVQKNSEELNLFMLKLKTLDLNKEGFM
jgi:hypothetical protein